MKLKVDKDLCIGCGACQAVCPEVFEIDEDGLAATIVDEVAEELVEDAIDAKEGCPTSAIDEVDEDGLAATIVDEVAEELVEDAIDAKEGCPTSAIDEVDE